MALLAAGSLANVYASLDQYLTDTLVTGAGVALQGHGVRQFIPPTDDPWVQAHYDFLGLQSLYQRQIGRVTDTVAILGTERRGYLQLNLYQRARVWATRYTTAAIRDVVVGAFPEGSMMPVYDYTGMTHGGTLDEVGVMIFDGLKEHVQDTGIRSGMIQHVLQIATRYLEHYTRP